MSENIERVELFIGGVAQPSSTGKYFDDLCPEDGSVWRLSAEANSDDLNRAVIQADTIWRYGFAQSTGDERRDCLIRTADIIERDKTDIALQISMENGAPIAKVEAEVGAAINYLRGCASLTKYIGPMKEKTQLSCSSLERERHPIGVCVVLSSFNNPLFSAVELSASALALGNTVVSLSSEFTPNVSLILAKIYQEAGLPDGAYNQLSGTSDEIAEQLVCHPMVQAVLYSGIAAEGMYLSEVCGPHMKRVLLDLDGSNTALFMRDADLERGAKAVAHNCFFFQGEGKEVTTRVVCEKKVFRKFTALLKSEAEQVVASGMGALSDSQTVLGPCISDFYVEHISMLLDDARKKGANFICGGRWQGGRLEPTILTDVTPEMSICRSTVLGPIVCLYKVNDFDEGLSVLNDSVSDLSASIWTSKPEFISEFSRRAAVSSVQINMLPDMLNFEEAVLFDDASVELNRAHLFELTEQRVTRVYQER